MEIFRKITEQVALQPAACDQSKLWALAPGFRMQLMQQGLSLLVCGTNEPVLRWLEQPADFYALFDFIKTDNSLNRLFKPVWLAARAPEEQHRELATRLSSSGEINLVGVAGTGVFAWGRNRQQAMQRLAFFLDLVRIREYGPRLSGQEVTDCLRSLADRYPADLTGSAGESRRLTGRIALVTGAAQGIGEGLAEFLLQQGATVVLADLNAKLAAEQACLLNSRYGAGNALALQVDVADESSVARMIRDTVMACGGLDLLVSNAGILRAGSLEEMDLAAFELATRINYTAFFLCVRYAAAVMKTQHRFNPAYFMDIVQINSKSGLEGSKKNFAYAGSKFGGIGLTQSFALELVGYNIKVNALCPGNFFAGPLWSDPEKGLFVQYLHTGKVPGAGSVDDVRKFYEAKVPMGRGCTIADVARALLYLIEQEYETGQALPVTGGQVMLK